MRKNKRKRTKGRGKDKKKKERGKKGGLWVSFLKEFDEEDNEKEN